MSRLTIKNIEFTKEQTRRKSDRYGELAAGITFELVEKYMLRILELEGYEKCCIVKVNVAQDRLSPDRRSLKELARVMNAKRDSLKNFAILKRLGSFRVHEAWDEKSYQIADDAPTHVENLVWKRNARGDADVDEDGEEEVKREEQEREQGEEDENENEDDLSGSQDDPNPNGHAANKPAGENQGSELRAIQEEFSQDISNALNVPTADVFVAHSSSIAAGGSNKLSFLLTIRDRRGREKVKESLMKLKILQQNKSPSMMGVVSSLIKVIIIHQLAQSVPVKEKKPKETHNLDDENWNEARDLLIRIYWLDGARRIVRSSHNLKSTDSMRKLCNMLMETMLKIVIHDEEDRFQTAYPKHSPYLTTVRKSGNTWDVTTPFVLTRTPRVEEELILNTRTNVHLQVSEAIRPAGIMADVTESVTFYVSFLDRKSPLWPTMKGNLSTGDVAGQRHGWKQKKEDDEERLSEVSLDTFFHGAEERRASADPPPGSLELRNPSGDEEWKEVRTRGRWNERSSIGNLRILERSGEASCALISC
ncbi:hypothetical protein GUITHDRAFT_116335 [Guillardia theta CCMP2712]|uniref:Uncharacterized protein n=1 Tax=Guillardia theta (strain CCMP2712) TaxID=905079 RepID=L1IMP1_GUITC|nr:hypothetical protein GUITHDRAFT_116335 [Guillardia theta CCMP2712]EKX37526.1 hypothetical protein GUITHDRAFT_116335 [Guillardia theta CCMP2712]|eukprot:XP_005824506.1 hypothetical protein GUITHDRAFT_116335 [Guillardia theta CCMP2712]